ncbi:hypothetical protein CPB83DRAFT_860417 [Crepidotus variabilis]|uniref:Microbial-type PARG catalytic domain-containing protein n=1 Tax=Crepidotus variabilis TaxID=179855 RepID=A0A9P6JLM9_9AGAR|nr:hypothetical protein CPB83DRAFT_860417 [Crepidotus variabilis]
MQRERQQKRSKPRQAKGNKPRQSAREPDKPRLTKPVLMNIAATTLEKIEQGSYDVGGQTYDLSKKVEQMKKGTLLYAPNSDLSSWRHRPSHSYEGLSSDVQAQDNVEISVNEVSTLAGTRILSEALTDIKHEQQNKIGVLNFASAKNPGGGFMTGAQAQEESIARSSTAYPSFMTPTAQPFYQSHRKDPKEGYYSHAMIYSPSVLLIRADHGDWLPPVEVDLLTSCAVNAGVVRRYLREANSEDESNLDAAMKERMARVLYLFEKQGVKNLVLGSFGTGVFRNRVELVATIWKELLVGDEARFARSFDRVVFAILGHDTYLTFERVFAEATLVEQNTTGGDASGS